MNAPAKIQPTIYAIPNAFDASGYIAAKRGPLQLLRAQWNQTFADMEDTIRMEMEEEKYRRKSKHDQEADAARAKARDAARETIAQKSARIRSERCVMVIDAILDGHKTQETIREKTGLTTNAFHSVVSELIERGVVTKWQERNSRGSGFRFCYEVAQ